MEKLFHEVIGSKGVTGLCFVGHERVYFQVFKEELEGIDSQVIVSAICSMNSTFLEQYSELYEFSTSYKETVLIVRQVLSDKLIIVFCLPGTKIEPLSARVNEVVDELELLSQAQLKVLLGDDTGYKAASVVNDSDLVTMLNVSVKVMGPIGEIVFNDAKEKWLSSNGFQESTITDFVSILKEEIDEPELVVEFERKLAEYSVADLRS